MSERCSATPWLTLHSPLRTGTGVHTAHTRKEDRETEPPAWLCFTCSNADTRHLKHSEKVTTHSEGEIQRLFKQLHTTPPPPGDVSCTTAQDGWPHPSAPSTSSSSSSTRRTRRNSVPNSGDSSPDDCGGNNSPCPAPVVNNHLTTTGSASFNGDVQFANNPTVGCLLSPPRSVCLCHLQSAWCLASWRRRT